MAPITAFDSPVCAFKPGDRVACNGGYLGTIRRVYMERQPVGPGAYSGAMLEIRLGSGEVCVSEHGVFLASDIEARAEALRAELTASVDQSIADGDETAFRKRQDDIWGRIAADPKVHDRVLALLRERLPALPPSIKGA